MGIVDIMFVKSQVGFKIEYFFSTLARFVWAALVVVAVLYRICLKLSGKVSSQVL